MQSNSAQSVPPKPALLLFLLLLLLLQHLFLLLHLPTSFSYFSNPSPPSSKSIAWQPLQPSSQPSSQVPHHNEPTLALFPLPAPQVPPCFLIQHFLISQISDSPSLELLSVQRIKINMLFYGWWILNCVVFRKCRFVFSWDIQSKGYFCFDIAWIIHHTSYIYLKWQWWINKSLTVVIICVDVNK